jgi:hypothetical protein
MIAATTKYLFDLEWPTILKIAPPAELIDHALGQWLDPFE